MPLVFHSLRFEISSNLFPAQRPHIKGLPVTFGEGSRKTILNKTYVSFNHYKIMKNFAGRFKFLVLLSIILFLYALGIQSLQAIPLKYDLQQEIVTGVVKDKAGMPLNGVTVLIKGTNQGTVTNINGEYEITVGPAGTLVFSYLGFQKRQVPVNGRSQINITLEEDVTALNEVEINAGYYNTTRRESTGNISRVTAEEIELQPVVSPLQALQGRMAGVEILSGGHHPGGAPTIRIRGRNSLREEGNYPLYIIDGVPINSTPIESNSLLSGPGIDPLSTLNLSNIKTIEVLKDADATAIYGSRGANGVVLITTKQGEYSDQGLQISTYTGVSWMSRRMDLLNTEQYLQLRRRAFENDGIEPTASNAPDLAVWDQERYTDWQDYFFGGTASVQDVNISAIESNDNTSFRLNGSYHKEGTIYQGNLDYRKFTGGLAVNHLSENEKFSFGLALNYGVDDISSMGNKGIIAQAINLPPNAPPLFNEDGTLHWEEWTQVGFTNPFNGYFNSSNTRSNSLVSNLQVSYELVEGLHLKSNFGYTNLNSEELVKMPKRSYDPASWENLDHTSLSVDNDRRSWIVEPQITFSKNLGKIGVDAIVGSTFQESEFSTTSLQGEGYVAESLIGNLSAAERILHASDRNTDYRYTALFGRIGLNYHHKYFLNLTGRRDGSSRFGPGNRFANFGAIGGAWIFSEESFLRNRNSFLSFGKLRASYGTTGNDQIGDYGYLDAYEATPGPGGLYPTQLSNPDFSWEENKKLEAALELGFFEDRLNLALSWYRNRSSNQLVGYPLPATTGFEVIQANLPATVENSGLELELNTINFNTGDFGWQSSFNLTLPENELIEYPGLEESPYANVYREGHSLDLSLLYQYDGVDPETGLHTVVDVNEDGRFDYADRVVLQEFGKDFYGGFGNNISYKNFSLQFLWDFAKQEGTLGHLNAGAYGNQRSESMAALEGSDNFQEVSRSYKASLAYSRTQNSDYTVVDASFLRLRNTSISYNLPPQVLEKLSIKNFKIFLNAQNLLTLTDYEGLDPEVPHRGTNFTGLSTVTGGIHFNF